MNYYTTAALYDRLTNFFLIATVYISTEFGKRSFSYLAPTVWNDLPFDTRLSPPPPIPLSAVSRQSSPLRIAYQFCPPSDCRRLRFSVTTDFVRLTNYYYIIIIDGHNIFQYFGEAVL